MTKKPFLFLLLTLFASCASRPRNLAESYVGAVEPEAICLRWGDNAVLCRERLVLFYCEVGPTRRTACQQLADMNPKPAPTASLPRSEPKPEPPKVELPKYPTGPADR